MKLCELLVQLAHWEKKILASKKTFKSAVLAAGTSGKRTNMRDQAEQTRRMTLNPTNQARSQQQEVSLIRQSNKQTSPWQDGRSETGSGSECRWQITGSLTGTLNRWTTKKHRTGDWRTSVARCKTEGQLCRVGWFARGGNLVMEAAKEAARYCRVN